jgi:PAS domain S-box-containing protein
MKVNTALGMLLCGAALALTAQKRVTGPIRFVVVTLALAVIVLGILTLGEDIFGWNSRIDQLLLREAVAGVESSGPGRMSPSTAFGLLLMGTGLVLATRKALARIRLPLLAAIGSTVVLIGAMALMGHASNGLLQFRWWNYSGVAIHTATGFVFLGAGLLALVRSAGGLAWSLDILTSAGFAAGVLSLLAASGVSYHFTNQFQQAEVWVDHTQQVLDQAAKILAGMAALENGERGYIITADETFLTQREQDKRTVGESLASIRSLTADNPRQQPRLDDLEKLIAQRNAFEEQAIIVRKESGFTQAQQMIARGAAVQLSAQADQVIRDIQGEEYALLKQRRKTATQTATTTFLLLPLGTFLSLVLLSSGLFFLNAGVGERKHTENALRDSEMRFQSMVNGIPQLAWMAEADGHIFWYNQRWYDYTGTTSEQMEGWGWKSVHDPEVLPNVLDRWKIAIANGTPFDMEFPLRGADGSFRAFLTRVSPVKNSEGRVVRWLGTNTDISERKQAEDQLAKLATELAQKAEDLARSRGELEAQTAMLKLILDSMGEGLIAADLEGHFLIWNDAAKQIMGRGAADIPTEEWTPHYQVFLSDGITPCPPDRLPLVRALQGESVQVQLIVQSPETVPGRFIEVTSRPLKDARGSLCGGVAVLHDISERKQSEAELARHTEELGRSRQALKTQTLMLESVLDSMAEGLVAADEHGKFLIWNPAAQRIVGYGPTDLGIQEWSAHYGQYLPDGITPLPAEQNPLARAIRGEACTTEIFLRNRAVAGGIWIEANATPLKDTDGMVRGGVVAFRDITQRRTDEYEIRKLNDELESRVSERTAQLEAANKDLAAFSYSVSHDLRAPLRAVDGFSHAVLEDFGPQLPEEGRRQLQMISEGAQRMGDLIDDLLRFSQLGRKPLEKEWVDADELVRAVVANLIAQDEPRHPNICVSKLPSCQCDPALFRQVWVNLVSNALKYSSKRAQANIEIGCKEQDGENVYFIRDNGTGFDMRYADKLFGVFQRLHLAEDFEGTGVGLAIVHQVIKRHDGRVWAEAKVDHGATFYFTLGGNGKA